MKIPICDIQARSEELRIVRVILTLSQEFLQRQQPVWVQGYCKTKTDLGNFQRVLSTIFISWQFPIIALSLSGKSTAITTWQTKETETITFPGGIFFRLEEPECLFHKRNFSSTKFLKSGRTRMSWFHRLLLCFWDVEIYQGSIHSGNTV